MDQNTYQYLEAQVLAATPQKLRLLLIQGALRLARQVLDKWDQNQEAEANQLLIHCRAIIMELASGVQLDESDLSRRVLAIYMFLFRCLAEAQLGHDRGKVKETIRVLEVERETWQLVCEKMPNIGLAGAENSGAAPRPDVVAPLEGIGGPPTSHFSFDA